MADAEVESDTAGDGGDPAGEFRAVAQQPQPPVTANERLLRGFFGERGVAQTAPGDGEDEPFMAFHQFTVSLQIAITNCGHDLGIRRGNF